MDFHRFLFRLRHGADFMLLLLGFLALSSCSTTRNLPQGETLYIGIGKTRIANKDASKEGAKAISAVENTLRVAPNNAIFGSARARFPLPVGLWVYNALVNDTTFTSRRLFRMFATEPVLISRVNPPTRSVVARNILREHGYFRADVRDSLAYNHRDPKKARVIYSIDMGIPFKYDSIRYLPTRLLGDSVLFDHSELSLLRKGEQFNIERISEDRTMVVQTLRNQGYYFYHPDLITYRIDTLQQSGKIQMRVEEKENVPDYVYRPWQIGSSTLYIHNSNDGEELTDSLEIEGFTVRYAPPLKLRRNVLGRRLLLKPGGYYEQNKESGQSENLSRLGVFSYVDTQFRATDTMANRLDMQIHAVLDKPWDTSVEGRFTSKSNNYVGPGVNFSLTRKNLFGGGEQFSSNLWGSYEFLINAPSGTERSNLNSYEAGIELNLSASSILLPRLYNRMFSFSPSTSLSLSGSMLNRAFFFRMYSLGLSAQYAFRRYEHSHQFAPLRLQYNALTRQSETFLSIIQENPVLGLSLRNQLIPQMSYTYTFDNAFTRRGDHHIWFEGSVSQAGNIIHSLATLSGKDWSQTQNLFGVPYAQFVKTTAELRYTYSFLRDNSLAMRFSLGGIWSYGNMNVAPYSEQFYVGGANSVRAFSVRTLGPGRYAPTGDKYGFLDQSGEFKLEGNIEYRLRLAGNLFGALFLDSGNVWLWKQDPRRPGASLQEVRSATDFFEQIALGTGLGFRYDLGVIVVRFDVGMGLHLPYKECSPSYFNAFCDFEKHLGYHLAIGYPF